MSLMKNILEEYILRYKFSLGWTSIIIIIMVIMIKVKK